MHLEIASHCQPGLTAATRRRRKRRNEDERFEIELDLQFNLLLLLLCREKIVGGCQKKTRYDEYLQSNKFTLEFFFSLDCSQRGFQERPDDPRATEIFLCALSLSPYGLISES